MFVLNLEHTGALTPDFLPVKPTLTSPIGRSYSSFALFSVCYLKTLSVTQTTHILTACTNVIKTLSAIFPPPSAEACCTISTWQHRNASADISKRHCRWMTLDSAYQLHTDAISSPEDSPWCFFNNGRYERNWELAKFMGSVFGCDLCGGSMRGWNIREQPDKCDTGRPSAVESDDEKDTTTAKIGALRRRARLLEHSRCNDKHGDKEIGIKF